MKKLLALLFSLGMMLFFAHDVQAANSVEDQIGLFTEEEIAALNTAIDSVDEQFKGSMYIVTTNSSIDDIEEYTDDYLRDKVGNNNNGTVLAIDMRQRQFHISTSGNMIDYLTDKRRDEVLDEIQSAMAAGNYSAAANTYVTNISQYIEAGIPDRQYQVDRDTGKITYYKSITLLEGVIAVAIAAILGLAFFFVTLSRYQLRMGGYKYPYREKANLELTDQNHRLVNSFVTTRRIPRNNGGGGGGGFGGGGGSTTHSSGGGTFGGGGRSF